MAASRSLYLSPSCQDPSSTLLGLAMKKARCASPVPQRGSAERHAHSAVPWTRPPAPVLESAVAPSHVMVKPDLQTG